MELEASLPWLALGFTTGLGSRLIGKLLRTFGQADAVFAASLTALESCSLPAAVAQAVRSRAGFRDAERELVSLRKENFQLVNWDESEYPPRLLEIYDPPPLLYVARRHPSAAASIRFRWWARGGRPPTGI